MSRYDASGNEYEPEDVLDPEELAEYHQQQADRARSSARVLRAARAVWGGGQS